MTFRTPRRDLDDPGLGPDLATWQAILLKRRRLLGWLAGALPVIGCGGGGSSSDSTTIAATTTGSVATLTTTTTTTTAASGSTTATSSTGTGTASDSCSVIPTETNGPYPADGTSSLNALLMSGIVRSDIRSSFGGATAVAAGVPLTVTLTLVNANASCAVLSGYAIYIWHCNQVGEYSLYAADLASENYLRGVQQTDANGQVTFTTIFPGCYSGRWPHIHFEVYPSLATATRVANVAKTSQIALTQASCAAVYATSGYSASVANLAQTSLATDNVFSDGATLETPVMTGSASAGYALVLTIGIGA